jgi:hypothetical protein
MIWLDARLFRNPKLNSGIVHLMQLKHREPLKSQNMNELCLALDARWKDRGISPEWFREKSEWVGRDGGVPGGSDHFFADAGRLMRFCAYDYLLIGPMFFHAVIGLEGMLRVHYRVGTESSFKELLSRAVEEEVIADRLFFDPQPLPKYFTAKIEKPHPETHAGKLAALLPRLRNDYFHCSHLLAPELLHLTIEVREAARRPHHAA